MRSLCGMPIKVRAQCIFVPCTAGEDDAIVAVKQQQAVPSQWEQWVGSVVGWFTNVLHVGGPKDQIVLSLEEFTQLRDHLLRMQGYIKEAEDRAEQAEALLVLTRRRHKQDLKKAGKKMQLLVKYVGETEKERDALKKERDALKKELEEKEALLRKYKQAAKSFKEVLRDDEEVLLDDEVEVTPTAKIEPEEELDEFSRIIFENFAEERKQKDEFGLISPTYMTIEECRQECELRGLNAEGGLGHLRARVRAARAKDRLSAGVRNGHGD